MNSFRFHVPTEVIFGIGAENQAGEAVRAYGGKNVLLLYGGGSAVKSGLLDRVAGSVEGAGAVCQTLGGVRPNPLLGFAQRAVDEYRDKGIDFVLAVGGGSVIDTAKAVALGLESPGIPLWDYFTKKEPVKAALPVGVVLTIAAAGSETSDSAVLTNEESQVKRGVGSPFNRPRFAIMDPALTYTLPPRQPACGVVDIMMHTMDRYFATGTDNATTDALAEALLRTVIACGRTALERPGDGKARSELMWCGSLSHNGLTGLGQPRDFSVHALGHELSAKFDLPHGESLSIMWPAWAGVAWRSDPARFARFGRAVWGVTEPDDGRAALAAIRAVEGYFKSLSMPVAFSQAMGIQDEDVLHDLALRCTFYHARTIGTFHPLDEAGILEIYRAANR